MSRLQSQPHSLSSSVRTVRALLTPTPGFVVKTLTTQPAQYAPPQPDADVVEVTEVPRGHKVFINICYDEHVPPPADVPQNVQERAIRGEGGWAIPCIPSDGRTDLDKAGKPALVFDVIFHPSLSERVEVDDGFQRFLKALALERIEDKSGLSLSRNTSVPKLASKGALRPRPAIVPVPVQKPSIEVLSDTSSTPSLTTDAPTPSPPARPVIKAKRVPTWTWKEDETAAGVLMLITLPHMTHEDHPNTTLDLEPRRLILTSPAFATLDASLSVFPRDVDTKHAWAEWHVDEQNLVVFAAWAA